MINTYQGGQYGLGIWLPGIAVLCNLLSNRFIRKDEKLVRDSERLDKRLVKLPTHSIALRATIYTVQGFTARIYFFAQLFLTG